jgi:tight adherence protein B
MALDLNAILMIAGGLGLLLLLAGLIMSSRGRSVVEERLGRYSESAAVAIAGEEPAKAGERSTPLSDFFNRLGEGTSLFEGISRDLARADLKLRPGEYIAVIIISAIVVGAIGALIARNAIFGVLAMFVGGLLPRIYVSRAQGKRLKMFDNQLGDMLSLMVNGLRAGYSTLMAMEAVSREMPSPIADEFRRVVQEIQLGISMDEALNHLVRRINSDDLDMVITAIDVQREVGGNLAEVLDNISETIRERVRIRGEIMALTAMGRYTAWIISLLPVFMVVFLYLANREYLMQFFNPGTRMCGIPLLILAGLMIIAGFIAVQKIVNIDI